jgi:DNA-binding NarL/FixJ family response regulator
VLVVDDDPLVIELIVGTLSEHGYAIRTAADAHETLQIVRRETPEVVLLDVHLPDVSGYQLCQSIREDYGDTIGIILISGERKESLDRSAGLLLGADDYLVKPFNLDELLARVHRLARRSRPVARRVAEQLTRRELQILRSLSSGMDHVQVAHHLVITPKTVEKHIEHILLKLGVHSRAQAIALAFQDEAPIAPTLIELKGAASRDAAG